MPWQATLSIIILAIILAFIVLIISVVKNENVDAKAELKDKGFGISIKDSKSNKKTEDTLHEKMVQTEFYNFVLFSVLKTHPLYTTIFNHIVYSKSENTINMIKNIIKDYSNNTIQDILEFELDYISTLYRVYIGIIKNSTDGIVNSIEDYLKTKNIEDIKRSLNNFISDIENMGVVRMTLDNIKTYYDIRNNVELDDLTKKKYASAQNSLNDSFMQKMLPFTSYLKRDLIVFYSNFNMVLESRSENIATVLISIVRIFDSILNHIYEVNSFCKTNQICEIVSIDGDI